MSSKLYLKENNLFQSPEWLNFQESYGRKGVPLDKSSGIELNIPLGKKFVWIQKAPLELPNTKYQLSNLEKSVVFVRIEPEAITKPQVNTLGLKPVTKNSLLSGQASPKATRILDLTKSEEELLAEMKPKTRYNIRLAEKKGVNVKKIDNVNILYEMLSATSQKGTGYSPHEKSYYSSLMETLGKRGIVSIYTAEFQGEQLAAIMISHYGQVATYLHGGQSDSHKNLMAPYLCQWAAIKEAKETGCEVYDFWGVAESDDPNDSWAGISRFKEGFGGEKVIFPGTFDLVLRPFWYNLLTLLAHIRHLIN